MTIPRQILPSRTYILTRRCAQRQYLLRPDSTVTSIFLFCVAEAVERFDITLHGYLAMSNHSHLIVRDNQGNLPRFMGHLHKMIAKAVNAYWGRWENFWASGMASAVHLVGAHDRFTKLVYLLANPVASQLVERVADWPGASSLAQHLSGKELTVHRPSGFFRDDGPMPERVQLRVERVDGFEDLTRREWSEKIAGAVRAAEDLALVERIEKDSSVLGRDAVLRAVHTDRPATIAPRRIRQPHVACRDVERRTSALAELSRFRAEHRAAVQKCREGDGSAQFPVGTYAALGSRKR